MELSIVQENELQVAEGVPDEPWIRNVDDSRQIVEACLSAGVDAVMLYPDNLTPAFFERSSREAGEILQKLRNYRIRLAVVCAPGTVKFSTHFGEVIAEERKGRWFNVCETREAALEWLTQQ